MRLGAELWRLARHERMRQHLIDAWEREQYADHPWWEQAAVLELMGYHVTRDPVATLRQPTELHARTQALAPEWNHHLTIATASRSRDSGT